MDKRLTFENINHLLEVVTRLYVQKQKVALIVDNHGLERMEGMITNLQTTGNAGETRIELDGIRSFQLHQVIGINGHFRSDYSEC